MDGMISATELCPCAFMHVQSIPYDKDRGTELASELAKEAQQAWGDDVLVREEAKIESRPASSGRDGQGRDHRDALAGTRALIDDGCMADRCPGASDERSHEEAAFIKKDNTGFQSPGVFFTRGHSFRTQSRIAVSFRSRARRSGFCGLKPRDRRRRLM